MIVVGLLGVLPVTPDHEKPLLSLSSAADEVAASSSDVELPQSRGSDGIRTSGARFGDMASKLAESEQLSRNCLMTGLSCGLR